MQKRIRMFFGGVILSVGMLATTPMVNAAEMQVNGEKDIELAYENVSVCTSKLSIVGREATCKSLVKAKKSKQIRVIMKLQKHLNGEWKTLKEWSGSTTGTTYSLNKNYVVETGTYRVRTTFKVGTETIIKNSNSVKR
ncbi:MAG: hypothetical protein Q4F98_08980 [Lachnospiraceae bacterium]|nr:hypothetical protein [Lachnospiraceae bacterium]